MLAALRTGDGRTLVEHLRRPQVQVGELLTSFPELTALGLDAALWESVVNDVKYEGYVRRQREDVERLGRQEAIEIPPGLDFATLRGLGNEAREKLSRLRPRSLGAAGRIAGVRPPDVALLAVHLERLRRAGEPKP
jgi:tRNA uridine 5-carboxymethylaminomethyl modification enzyme